MLIASVHHVIGIKSDIPTRAIQVRREIVPIAESCLDRNCQSEIPCGLVSAQSTSTV